MALHNDIVTSFKSRRWRKEKDTPFFPFFFDLLLFKKLSAEMTGRDDGVFKRVKVGSCREEV